MAVMTEDFATWLAQAEVPQQHLTPELQSLLRAVFRFRQEQGSDYFSTRLLSHFLLHCHSGLKVAHIARLLGISRPTASEHQGLSSKQVVQQAHHRLKGRPNGKLLPRFAGPIAGFLLGHPDASRADLLDFIESTFSVRVSRIAVYKFLKKYGLGHKAQPQPPRPAPGPPQPPGPASPPPASLPPASTQPTSTQPAAPPFSPAPALTLPLQSPGQAAKPLPLPPPARPSEAAPQILLPSPSQVAVLVPPAAPPFSSGGPNTRAPSC